MPRDPRGPSMDQLEHVVRLKPPITRDDHRYRLVNAREWCREHVDHDAGHRWHYRRVVEDDSLEYSFGCDIEAVMFRMIFG